MPEYKLFRFDVTNLTFAQRANLAMHVVVQAEASDDDETDDEGRNYPNVEVAEVCPYCHQALDYTNGCAECGGADEGICTEWMAVQEYESALLAGKVPNVEEFVEEFMEGEGIEDSVMPYRNDGLMYSGYLAAILCGRFDLKGK